MAGSVTKTSTRYAGGVTRHRLAWTSDASGNVSANSVTLPPGMLVQVAFIPGAGGVQPTDLYDVTMTCDDHSSVNVLDGGSGTSVGADLSQTNSTHKTPMAASGVRQWLHGGGYTLVVANAGNAKSGTVDLYLASSFSV